MSEQTRGGSDTGPLPTAVVLDAMLRLTAARTCAPSPAPSTPAQDPPPCSLLIESWCWHASRAMQPIRVQAVRGHGVDGCDPVAINGNRRTIALPCLFLRACVQRATCEGSVHLPALCGQPVSGVDERCALRRLCADETIDLGAAACDAVVHLCKTSAHAVGGGDVRGDAEEVDHNTLL